MQFLTRNHTLLERQKNKSLSLYLYLSTSLLPFLSLSLSPPPHTHTLSFSVQSLISTWDIMSLLSNLFLCFVFFLNSNSFTIFRCLVLSSTLNATARVKAFPTKSMCTQVFVIKVTLQVWRDWLWFDLKRNGLFTPKTSHAWMNNSAAFKSVIWKELVSCTAPQYPYDHTQAFDRWWWLWWWYLICCFLLLLLLSMCISSLCDTNVFTA